MKLKRPVFPVKGFTLLELVLVIVVVGVLSALALPQFGSLLDREQLKEAEANLKAIRAAERFYFLGDGDGGYTDDINFLRLDEESVTNSNYGYVFTGVPVSGAQAQDDGTPVLNIDFDDGTVTTP